MSAGCRLRQPGAAIALVLAVLGLAGCEPATPPEAQDAVRPVRTVVLQPRTIDLVGVFPGEIRPRIESQLAFQVSGRITERAVQTGDLVTAGQVLARLDPQDLQLAEAAARAELAAAEVERSRTAGDLERYTRLRNEGFISPAEFDQRKAAHDAAVARVQQARASLRAQSNQAGYATLHADAAGVVTAVEAEVGQVVAAGTPVVRVARGADKEIAFQIPEGRLEAVRGIERGTATLWTGGPEIPAVIREIAGSADPLTRAFPARATLLDAPEAARFGMTATVRFARPLAEPAAQVPLTALLRDGERTVVWVLDPGAMTVRREPVELLTVTDTEAVLAPGLPAGTEVVTAGVHLLREGQQVSRLAAPGAGAPADAGAIPAAMLPLAGAGAPVR